MEYKIFVSHGWLDRWVATQIARRLMENGAACFLDVFDIAKGDDFEDRIFKSLPDCQELLVLLTPRSVKRNWVWVEIGAARALNLRIVAVLYGVTLEEVDRDAGGKAFLGAKNVADINDLESYFGEVTRRVREFRK